MRDVVEHFEQLCPTAGSVSDCQFDIKVIALVQIVCGQRAHDIEFTMAGDPAVDCQEGEDRDKEEEWLLQCSQVQHLEDHEGHLW